MAMSDESKEHEGAEAVDPLLRLRMEVYELKEASRKAAEYRAVVNSRWGIFFLVMAVVFSIGGLIVSDPNIGGPELGGTVYRFAWVWWALFLVRLSGR
jgi:hypothetical protein